MDNKDLFLPVLDKNEEILKIYKPNKGRTIFTVCLGILFLFLFSLCWLTTLLAFYVYLGCSVVSAIFICIVTTLWQKKTVYAVTTKRILIRTGYIGVSFKSLDYTMLGALSVKVGLVDKLLRKNTGSIAFGSMASPMTNQAGAKFNFFYIQNPYEVYKEIKEIIDEHKDK